MAGGAAAAAHGAFPPSTFPLPPPPPPEAAQVKCRQDDYGGLRESSVLGDVFRKDCMCSGGWQGEVYVFWFGRGTDREKCTCPGPAGGWQGEVLFPAGWEGYVPDGG